MDLSKVPFGTKFKITGCKNSRYIGRIVVYTTKSKYGTDPHFLWEECSYEPEGWDSLDPVIHADAFKASNQWWVEIEPLKKVKRKVV